MTLIEQLKRDRDNLEVEYAAKRSVLDKIICRADAEAQLAANPPTAEPPTQARVTPQSGATREAKAGRPRKVRVVSNDATANAPKQPRHPAVPGRRPGFGTVAAAVREVLPEVAKDEFTGAQVGEAVLAKYPTLSKERDYTTKIAGALFHLREKAEIEIVRRVGNSPIYRLLKLREDPRSMFNAIHAEVDAKLAAKRAAEEG